MDHQAAFPTHPLRDVRARYVRQAGCPSDFADITVDFEPWEEGIAFEVHSELRLRGRVGPDELAAYSAAAADGIRDELSALDGPVAVAVVLRAMGVHDVDSHARAFRHAGRVAVRNALALLTGPPPRPRRRRPPPGTRLRAAPGYRTIREE
ncbi:hypothetical protein [Streptomyces sp. KL116D]|uniref:hypothetical protein n=1 Tax=Streptomyces sp. KL116D TaxID=3045152 RepID=UPI003556BC70